MQYLPVSRHTPSNPPKNYLLRGWVVGLVLASSTLAMPIQAGTLYQALGSRPGIHAIVRTFVSNVASDNRINGYFAHTDLTNLRKMLVLQFCQLSGGPCTYPGPNMKNTHASLGVTDAAFNALVEDLQTSLNKHHVALAAQNHLIALLAPMKSDIVTK